MRLGPRLGRLRRRLIRTPCLGCGRPLLDPPPEAEGVLQVPPPEVDRVVLPILGALLRRVPSPPVVCGRCGRAIDPDGWDYYLRLATPAEVATLARVLGPYLP